MLFKPVVPEYYGDSVKEVFDRVVGSESERPFGNFGILPITLFERCFASSISDCAILPYWFYLLAEIRTFSIARVFNSRLST